MASISKTSKEELEKIVKESSTYREVLLKLGYQTVNGRNNNTLKKYLNLYNISVDHFKINRNKRELRTKENVFCENSTATQAVLRKWFIKENYIPYKCTICGNEGVWNNQVLTLQLDHIDGNNKNNLLNNLRWLCPNCHSQTNTFGRRNGVKIETKDKINNYSKQKQCPICGNLITNSANHCVNCSQILRRKVARPDEDTLKKELFETNFSQVAKKYGVSDKAIRKWCKGYELPTKAKDYKK